MKRENLVKVGAFVDFEVGRSYCFKRGIEDICTRRGEILNISYDGSLEVGLVVDNRYDNFWYTFSNSYIENHIKSYVKVNVPIDKIVAVSINK